MLGPDNPGNDVTCHMPYVERDNVLCIRVETRAHTVISDHLLVQQRTSGSTMLTKVEDEADVVEDVERSMAPEVDKLPMLPVPE